MKTTLCFTLTLITFATLAFVPNSFAQDNSPEYVLRAIYFHPNDIEPHPDIDEILDYFIKDFQAHFADRMEFHRFGRKTFRFETDGSGDVLVHQVKGNFNDAHYSGQTYSKVLEEFYSRFGESKNIDFFVVDTRNPIGSDPSGNYDPSINHPCGIGGGNSDSGVAVVPAYGNCFGGVGTIAPSDIRALINGFGIHELLHAFGMVHDNSGDFGTLDLTPCAAEWLDGHPYFNHGQDKVVNHNTTIQMLPPTLASPPATIRLRFEITDPDGLHQAQLIRGGDPIIACQKLSGTSTTVEFITSQVFGVNAISLQVMDAHGNFTFGGEPFSIDLTNLLPRPETISVPDPILRTVLRGHLRLAPDETITQLNILNLVNLFVIDDVKDLTGLEYASNLRFLRFSADQLPDITPIAQLENLLDLRISHGQISDITSLAELTNLTYLDLSHNQISDISPLAEMTNLTVLNLWNNQISDISPLAEMTNLTVLNLILNQVSDISPLAEMTNLTVLNLSMNQASNISPLSGLTNLTDLNLRLNRLSDVSPLAGMENLQVLNLQNNQVSDVSPLSELVNLQELLLVDNPIEDRKPLLELLKKNPNIKIYLKRGEPLPVTLSHFRAERTDVGVILKWITESELDNAGFYIYRSETKDGEFKTVNPQLIQGAGTTSERNTYTWTDTTAKPNTVYYYRIEDISHAGVRKQLATVRMRGFVSATGKLRTSWADLKTQN